MSSPLFVTSMNLAPNPDTFYFLKALAERIDQAIYAYHIEGGQFTYLSPFFEQLWQQKRESVMKNPASLLTTIHPDDQDFVIKSYQQLLQGNKLKPVEFRLQLPDQTTRWLRLRSFLHEEAFGHRILTGVAEDISKEREEHDNLKKFLSKKDSVLEILSHDLARPLANIQGLASVISNRLKGYENQELNKLMEQISETSHQGILLIREFVQQEFLESTQADIVKKRVEIVHQLKNVIKQYQASGQEIKKIFHFVVSSKAIFLEVDDVKFMQVINNLISNAIKFTPDGGKITLGVEEQENHVLFSVEDNGIGIPSDLQEGLFEKFPKARRPGLKGEPSTGLGMSIIKTIVDWHGGQIWFESEENKGTTFFIKLPKQ